MANRYWVGGNANWDGTAGTKWATTSGGVGGAAVPTSVDDVFLDNGAGTGNVTLASGYAANCKTLVCTGYVRTLASADATGSCTIAGTLTFVAGMTLSVTNTFNLTTTATITSGGLTFAGILVVGGIGTQTHTLGDNWAVSGTLKFTGNVNEIINGNTFNVSGSLLAGQTAGIAVTGTTAIVLNGTGTWSHTNATTWICNNITINTAGTITISGTVYFGNGTLTYTTGTLVWTSSTLTVGGYSVSTTTVLTLGAATPNNLSFTGSGNAIVTLSANLTVNGNYIVSGNGSSNMNGFTLKLNGNLSVNTNGGIIAGGTTVYEVVGTTTWSHSTTGVLGVVLTINTAATFTVSGTVYKGAGVFTYTTGTTVWTGSTMIVTATMTLTLGTQQPFNITINAGIVITLSANLTITGSFATNTSGSNNCTINGFKLFVGGNLTIQATNALLGTTDIEMNGTGTWSHPSTTATISNNLIFNTAGTITISGNVYKAGTSALTWTAGTMVYTSSTINIVSTTTQTINLSGQTVNNFSIIGTNCTLTISNNFTVGGTFLVSYVSAANTTINGSTISCAGSFTLNAPATVNVGGTTNFTLTGTGTWSHSTTCVLTSSLTINTAGTITISGNVYKGGAATSITYTAGTVVTTGSTLNISADITLNTNGMSWNNISPTGTRTLTINSLLTATGTYTCAATTTFAGTSGWTVANWTCITAGVTVTFANGVTYTLSGGTMTNTGTAASKILFTSDHAVTKAILTLVGVTEANVYLSGTRMDSSLGATVWTVGGVLTSTINWNLLTAPGTIAYGFVN